MSQLYSANLLVPDNEIQSFICQKIKFIQPKAKQTQALFSALNSINTSYETDFVRVAEVGRLSASAGTEVIFVNAVTAGGSVKIFPSGVNFSRNNAICNINEGTKYTLS